MFPAKKSQLCPLFLTDAFSLLLLLIPACIMSVGLGHSLMKPQGQTLKPVNILDY